MYVCICNGLKEKDMRSVIQGGVSCVSEVYEKLGCRPQCGKCVSFVEDELMIDPSMPSALR